uniref:Putative reverse transcriptase-rnase h-integrase n=1 Tax=Moniliophthora roreri TaxID=221103 RepID=A0A0W0EVH0_MONRR
MDKWGWKGKVDGIHHLVCNLEAAAFNNSFEKLSLGPEEKQAFDAGFQSVVLISGISDLVVILFGIKEVEKLVGVWLEAVWVGDIFAISSLS